MADEPFHLDPRDLPTPEGGGESVPTVARALDHLRDGARGCLACRSVLDEYPAPALGPPTGSRYAAVFARAEERVASLAAELSAAPALLRELGAARDRARADALILGSPRFRTAGLALELANRAVAALDGGEPDLARSSLSTAAVVAERLDDKRYGTPLLEDLLAHVHAGRAAAAHATFRSAEAREALARAERYFRQGSRLPALRHAITLARAEWSLIQGRVAGVRDELGRARHWAERAHDLRLLWRAGLIGARAARLEGRPDRAAVELRLLVLSMRGTSPAGLEAEARFELVAALHEAGDPRGAFSAVTSIQLLDSLASLPSVRARAMLWLGRLFRDTGHADETVAPWVSAWTGFAREGMAVEAVGTAAELAAVLLQENRSAEARRLAAALPDIVLIPGLPPWAMRSLFALLKAIESGDSQACESIGGWLGAIARREAPPPEAPIRGGL